MLIAMDAEPFESDAIESRLLANERELPRVYLPSLDEIEALKRQIRAENEAREALEEEGPPYLKMYRQPRVLKTDYSQGRIPKSLL
jgi:hypothetical protein